MSKILFGILVGIAVAVLAIAFGPEMLDFELTLEVGLILVGIAFVVLILFIFSKVGEHLEENGYEEEGELTFEHEIVETIRTINGDRVCVVSETPNSYTFYTKEATPFKTGAEKKGYVCNTIVPGADVTIIEQDDCKAPKVVAYAHKVKKIWYAFFLGDDEKYKVYFYIPKGSHVLDI